MQQASHAPAILTHPRVVPEQFEHFQQPLAGGVVFDGGAAGNDALALRGNTATTVAYDTDSLFPTTVTDPMGNVTTATIDYRVLAPSQVTVQPGEGSKVNASFSW